MIKHILLFKIEEGVEGRSKAESIAQAKALIEGMNGKIPGLIKVEVGVDFSESPDSADMALYSEFESREALEVYAGHPEHKAVLPFIKSIISERRLIDYEV
ncbi:MAG: Dabb family protein [Oceanicoccus sp.]|uniref:Dabb family protein n=1 Tax=Oceanicoccus sp. TaxID=2691044 RepID=UPI00260479B9|nr:Dabb family protein [Oceanicoccus sp.]MCP3907545.1 Dabb family protein [Oceanicoccus sp.]MDG1772237.1 Dabb family protein [Oceanicoccus sp.]